MAINVPFVGCGRIADLHILGYQHDDRARVYALCDTDEAILEQRKVEWGVEKITTDFDEILADPKVDAVEILTPQLLHESMTIAAARAGKHIALQKPMTIDLASADRMIEAVQDAGVVFKITENYVFYPPIVLAKKLVEDGAIGDLVHVRIQFISGPEGGWEVPAAAWEWRLQEANAGRGPSTFDHGHHLWSTSWFLGGQVERVSGWIDSSDGIIDCPANFMWKYADNVRYGSCSFVHGSHLRVPSKYYSNDEWIDLLGSRGVVSIRRCTGNIKDGPPVVVFDGERHCAYDEVAADWCEGFIGATINFIDAIEGKEAPLLDLEQGREILRFSLALTRSSQKRRELYLDEMDRRFPNLYAFKRKRREIRKERHQEGLLARLGFGLNRKKLAPMAHQLTEDLVAGFDGDAKTVPDTCIGLILKGDDLPEEQVTLLIEDNVARLEWGEVGEDAPLTVTMRPSTWAAVLLKKQRIEMALIRRQIKFTGRAEEALKLKDAFDF